jgi:hypothetical protein
LLLFATGQLLGIPAGIALGFGLLWLINKFGRLDWYVNNPRSLAVAGRWDVPWESRTALAQAEEGLARAVAPLEGDPKRRSSTEQNPGRFRSAYDRGKPADEWFLRRVSDIGTKPDYLHFFE